MNVLTDKQILTRAFDPSKPLFRYIELLKHFNGIIPNSVIVSGGCISQILCNYETKSQDVDIYVHASHASDILNAMQQVEKYTTKIMMSPTYDDSFLKKNGILMIIDMYAPGDDTNVSQIMVTSRPPIEVVSSFDLTCCQNFFDGTNIYGTHLRETMSMQCLLQKDYVVALMEGNQFTASRVKKYTTRGFSISFDQTPHTTRGKPLSNGQRKYHNCSWEELSVKGLTQTFATTVKEVFDMATQGYTIENALKNLNIINDLANPVDRDLKDGRNYLSHYIKLFNYSDHIVRAAQTVPYINMVDEEFKESIMGWVRILKYRIDDIDMYNIPSTYKGVTYPFAYDEKFNHK